MVCSGEVVLVGKGLAFSGVLVALSADFLFYWRSGQDFLRASMLEGYLNVLCERIDDYNVSCLPLRWNEG